MDPFDVLRSLNPVRDRELGDPDLAPDPAALLESVRVSASRRLAARVFQSRAALAVVLAACAGIGVFLIWFVDDLLAQ